MRDVPNTESAGYDLIPPLAEMVVCLLKTTVLSLSMVEGVSVGLA